MLAHDNHLQRPVGRRRVLWRSVAGFPVSAGHGGWRRRGAEVGSR
jgi:hypothetical protein